MPRTLTPAFIAAAICAAAISPQCASAADISAAFTAGREPFRFEYRYNRADLETEQGAQRVYRNLIRKAHRACSESGGLMSDVHRLDRRCAAELVNNVVLRIGSSTLAQLRGSGQIPRGI